MNRAFFLDRDGTINVDYGYVKSVDQFAFLPHAIEGLKKLSDLGFLLIIVSNQSGIGRGLYSLENYQTVMKNMQERLKEKSIVIQDVFFCPHSPESKCPCRKPSPKMILDAIQKWDVDIASSFLAGDKETDIQAGKKAGLTTFLISATDTNYGQNHTTPDLLAAAQLIEKQYSQACLKRSGNKMTNHTAAE
ncbi:MAG: HAD family hydrolase [Candidatus Aureabacteria bacterium]|nr:HAD family hydrolase [Candidatus Auribacterota bacterium]